MPKQSPRPKRWHPSPDPMESTPLGRATPKVNPGGPPSSKRWEVPSWFRTLKPNHAEAFNQDSDLVRETRREFFLKHSYNFVTNGTHNLSEVFRQMATSANLLGTSIHEIQASWTGPDELKQANYALRSLPKVWSFYMQYPPPNLLSWWDWWEYMNQMPYGILVAWPTALCVERRARTRGPWWITYKLYTTG